MKIASGALLRHPRCCLSCHPDEASNASGWKDLGELRVSEAGSGFENRAALLYCCRRERPRLRAATDDKSPPKARQLRQQEPAAISTQAYRAYFDFIIPAFRRGRLTRDNNCMGSSIIPVTSELGPEAA